MSSQRFYRFEINNLPLNSSSIVIITWTACCRIVNFVCGLSDFVCIWHMRPSSLKASLISRTRNRSRALLARLDNKMLIQISLDTNFWKVWKRRFYYSSCSVKIKFSKLRVSPTILKPVKEYWNQSSSDKIFKVFESFVTSPSKKWILQNLVYYT